MLQRLSARSWECLWLGPKGSPKTRKSFYCYMRVGWSSHFRGYLRLLKDWIVSIKVWRIQVSRLIAATKSNQKLGRKHHVWCFLYNILELLNLEHHQKKTSHCIQRFCDSNVGKWLKIPEVNQVFKLIMKRIFLCDKFFVGKCIGDYGKNLKLVIVYSGFGTAVL